MYSAMFAALRNRCEVIVRREKRNGQELHVTTLYEMVATYMWCLSSEFSAPDLESESQNQLQSPSAQICK